MSGTYTPPRRYASPPQDQQQPQQHPALRQQQYPDQYDGPQDSYANNYQIPPAGTIPPAGSYLNRPTSSGSNRPGSAHSNSRGYSQNPNPHHANPHNPHAAPDSQYYPHEHNCPPDHTGSYNAPPNVRSDFNANSFTPHSGIPPAGAPYNQSASPSQQYGHGAPPQAGAGYGGSGSPAQQYGHGAPPHHDEREEEPAPKFIAQQGRTFTTMLGKKGENNKPEGLWGKLFG